MDLRQLECFLAVADTLHFGRAAGRVHLSQSAVSEAVRRLERELGGPLFTRTTRTVTMTPLGRAFLDGAGPAYAQVEDAYRTGRRLARGERTTIRLGHAMDPGDHLLGLVPELRACCPDAVLTLHPLGTAAQLDAVERRRLDAGLCWLPERRDALEYVELGSAPLVAVVPLDHPLAGDERTALRRLADEPLIGWPRAVHPQLYDAFRESMDALDASWSLVGVAVGFQNVASRVLAGQGVGMVPEPVTGARTVPGLAYVAVDDGPRFGRFGVRRHDAADRVLDVLFDLVRHRLAGAPRGLAEAVPG